jgi:hypothetical protein
MCLMLNTENAMWLRGRWLSYVVVMLVVPLCCEAQGAAHGQVAATRYWMARRSASQRVQGSGSRTFQWFAILICEGQ